MTHLQRRRALAAARKTIRQALARGRRSTTASRSVAVVGACLGLTSGGDDSPMAPLYRDLLARLLPRCPVRMEMDAVTNMTAAGCGKRGVVVIAGGGSIAYTVVGRGKIIRAGGWGSALGDEGSGYAIGRAAIAAVAREEDGRGPRTTLTPRLLAHFHAKHPHEIRRSSPKRLGVAEIAHLAPLVSESAAHGDREARRILRQAAVDLADLAAAVLKRSGLSGKRVPVFLTGGVFNDSRTLRPAFVAALRARTPWAIASGPRFPPVIGAVLLALKDAGVPWRESVLRRLEVSWRLRT